MKEGGSVGDNAGGGANLDRDRRAEGGGAVDLLMMELYDVD